MGREIRRVPPDWKHPKDKDGDYLPLYDNDYESAAQEWVEGFMAWQRGERPKYCEDLHYYWEYSSPPDEELYRTRKWTPEEATHYQIYQTVSEGTPTSPVFSTLEELAEWLVGQGYSREAAEGFARTGWAPSMLAYGSPATGYQVWDGIEGAAQMPRAATEW